MTMHSSHVRSLLSFASALLLAALTTQMAQAGNKPAAPKAAPAPKAAAPSRPSGGGGGGASHMGSAPGGGASASHSGFSTGNAGGGAQHSGFSTSNPGGGAQHSGFSTANPGGAAQHQGFSTANPGGAAQHQGFSTTNPGGAAAQRPGFSTGAPGGAAGGAAAPGRAGAATSPMGGGAGARPGMNAAGQPGGARGMGGMNAGPQHAGFGGGAAPNGVHSFQSPHGDVMQRPGGGIRDVHGANGMDMHHGLDGSRRMMMERPDHSRVFAEHGRPGYIERGYGFHGHDFARRSFYDHGHEYHHFYRDYYYHGVMVDVYVPEVYYGPAFYGWVYNPWYAPVTYSWGWGPSPWYGYYGYYFAPAPVYATPAEWLTDYVVSSNLQNAYAAQQANGNAASAAPAGGQPVITPEIKAQIAEEVRNQIALENQEAQLNKGGQDPDPASSSINRLFADGKPHTFVAASSLDVVDLGGNECLLTDGDVLRGNGPLDESAVSASMTVVASKGGRECGRAATVTVPLADLQEMQNSLRASVDQGMAELASNQGKKGLPAEPHSAMGAPVQSAFAQAAPAPESDGASEVNRQLAAADQLDQQVGHDLGAPAAAPAASGTVDISAGQSIDQVTTSLGQPLAITQFGEKKIYKYKDMTVVFRNGKVIDVR